MKDVLVSLLVTIVSAGVAWAFFAHPAWSEGDAVGRGIRWGAAFSALVFGIVTVLAIVRLVI